MRVDPQARIADVTIEFETGAAIPVRRDHDQPGRDRRIAGAALPALPRERAVQRHRAAAHAVRAGRQPVFLHRRSAARGPRPRGAHRANRASRPSPIAAIATSSAWDTAPTRRCAARSPGKTGASIARPPLPHGDQGRGARRNRWTRATHAHRRSGHREIHAAAHRRTRTSRRHRRPAPSISRPSFTHVRRSWFGRAFWQRVTYVELLRHRVRIRRIEPHRKADTADSRHQLRAGAAAITSARRCSAARCSWSCAARTARWVRIRTSCRCACRPSACSTSQAPKWHVLLRGDIGATAVSQHQRPRAVAALLRRRRSQRARLRRQRSVAGGAGHDRTDSLKFNEDGTRCWKRWAASTCSRARWS